MFSALHWPFAVLMWAVVGSVIGWAVIAGALKIYYHLFERPADEDPRRPFT